MFSPGSLEKNCVRPESCSPGRNASTRFPVGIPPMGDENQQVNRIQLAVKKYNNSGSIRVSNRSGFLSPVRHCLLKNTRRSKNYETEEGTTKSEKKSANYYDGVGAFPTIHLRKSAIRYRPIRKFHDVKVPYPELPVNRYLSHLPELCTDLKSSTRSVLDVLQDLSAKKIQDEDDGSNKTKSKGLAGDYIADPNALYKPLFVQKPKLNSVTTRDSMTQTLSPFRSDTPSPQICNLNSRNDLTDPKAELRKKLAKQNNEISASLSSSVPSFAIKRKIDKIATVKDDDHSSDVSAVKKSRVDRTNQTENGFQKSVNDKNESVKANRKLKLMDASSPSPKKDRLTSIFLDIRNTSPKSHVFQNSDTPIVNGVSNGFGPTPSVGTPEASAGESPKKDSGNAVNEESKPGFTLPVSKSDSASPKPMFQFGLPNSNGFNFKPTGSPPSKNSADASQTSAKDAASNDKKDETPKTFAFGSSENDISGFKFGSDAQKSPVEDNTKSSGVATTTAQTAASPQFTFGIKSSEGSTPSMSATPAKSSFAFGQNSTIEGSKTATSPTTASPSGFGQNVQPGTFTFGQKPSNESSPIQTSTQTNSTTSTPSTTLAPGGQNSVLVGSTAPTTALFSFGQKAETTTGSETSTAEQKPQFTFSFGQKVEAPKAPEVGDGNLFTFGQKSPPETTQAPNETQTFGQPAVSFGATPSDGTKPFGELGAPAANPNGAPSTTQSTLGFSATQTPLLGTTTGQSTPAFGVSTTAGPAFGSTTTTTSVFGTATTTTPAFGTSTATTAPAFGTSAATTAPAFGTSAATTAPAFGTSTATTTPAFGTSTATTTPAFGTSAATTAPAFGTSTATTTPGFGASTTTTSTFGASTAQPAFKFGANTTQTTTFGVPSSNQNASTTTTTATTAFGLNAVNAESMAMFGAAPTQSTPTFGVSSASPAFGTSAAPAFGTTTSTSAPMFSASSSTLTTPSFGAPTTQISFGAPTTQTAPAFGAPISQSIPTFGTTSALAFAPSSTVQSTSSFGSSTATSTPAFGAPVSNGFGASPQPNNIFGAPVTTQSGFGSTTSTSVFGTSSGFGATSSQSNAGFGARPFGKSSAPSIFVQNTAPAFASGSTFMPIQKNIFEVKPNEKEMFGQNKIFGVQNNFQFGSTTANSTGFTTSPPTTAAAPVFSFGGGGAPTNTFSFSSTTSNAQTPFAFTRNEPFKYGGNNSKENAGFGAGASPNFNFGGQMNNAAPNMSGFNFSAGSSSSPSVFSFGVSGSSGAGGSSSSSSGRGFNFGTPTPGAGFGQSTPTFGVPGTFSIGSGSSQPRPRAASRLRRRP